MKTQEELKEYKKKYWKKYLEERFKVGMNWDNWSQTGWHIDHVKPLSSFKLSNESEIKKAFHYTNLQPLWAKDNHSKSKSML